MTSASSTRTAGQTLSASAGLWSAAFLASGYAIAATTAVNLSTGDVEYVRVMAAERMKWELVTFVRIVGGILMLWFAGSLAGRLRLAEGDAGRLASAVFGLGVVWSGVWLLSAFFNSASILLAASYGDPAGARVAGILARETPYVLTGCLIVTLLMATAFVTLRSDRFPKIYSYATAALIVPLTMLIVLDWYGPSNLSPVIVGLALVWTAVTSAVLMAG
jgi:hypothetical protein